MTDTSQIKERIDVVDFLSEYLQLKQAGANWKGNCPFHNEKTPSFMVSREKQMWHCFGCGKGGDIFEFLMEMEGMEFVEALKVLAERAGIEISFSGGGSGVSADKKTRLREINSLATKFFQKVLKESSASVEARTYLENRGVSQEMIEQFQVGFIPELSWTVLTDFLVKKKGFGIEECYEAGTTKRSQQGRYFDSFRGRVMFPIFDVHNSVVGFTGRLLKEKEGVGKYINTPETPLFDKSRLVYGLNFAKQEAKQKGYLVVAEGQLDVISAHQIGMTNVVAASGTALTQHHIQILKRYVPQIRVAFDSDSAGERAAKRGIDLALEAGLDVKVITIPPDAGDDPDDCIQKNPQVWRDAVENAEPVFDYYINRYVTSEVRGNSQKLKQVSDLLADELSRVGDPVVADFWAQKISGALGTSVESVKNKAVQMSAQKNKYSRQDSGAPNGAPSEVFQEKKVLSRAEKLSQYIMCIFVKMPELTKECAVDPLQLASEQDRLLYSFLTNDYNEQHGDSSISSYKEVIELLASEKLFGFSEKEIKQELQTAIAELAKLWQKQQQQVLLFEIKQAEERGDNTLAAELTQKYHELTKGNYA